MTSQTLVVIGGGAAGFFGAIQAKSRAPRLEVIILESAPKCLGKVKISGGGRCNVTHACFDADALVQYYPRGGRELKSVFSRFAPQNTVAWFQQHGVKLKTESDGRMFPVTDDSQTIIDCLVETAQKLGICVFTRHSVETLIQNEAGKFIVKTPAKTFEADFVLLATGSNRPTYQWLEALGHQIVSPVASLFTFKINDPRLTDLQGISVPHVKGKLTVPGEKPVIQEGPLLITHWGLSGPVILRLSAWGARLLHDANYRATLSIDFFPEVPFEALQQKLIQQKQEHPKRQIGQGFSETISKRFWHQLLHFVDVNPETSWVDVPQKSLNRLTESLKSASFAIGGKGVFKDEFVTAGGVNRREIDFKTMESRVTKGLYLAGEVIDIDGLTGGFNFQNAWSTSFIAGSSIASEVGS